MKRKLLFYFSARQKAVIEDFPMEEDIPTFFRGREYTECYEVGADVKPHGERFDDSVFLGEGFENEIKFRN